MSDSSSRDEGKDPNLERRGFIATSLKAAGATALLGIPVLGTAAKYALAKRSYTVQDVIDIILKEVPNAPFKETVDTIKSGSSSAEVTGIVTTMFTTVKVIQEAVRLNANFIITHEPTFYNHTDDVNWVADNAIVKKKQDLLLQHNITVWRFHDYWHACKPDGISTGVLHQAGWQQYYREGDPVTTIPAMSLKKLIEHLESSLTISHLKVIGNMEQVCERIILMPGAAGGQRQISLIEKEKPDVLIVGEVNEWETAEYVRDARSFGSKTALIILGHCVSEEPGMEYLVQWLAPKIPGMKVVHVASGDPFTWT
jgi:putative NIF3 family GTP cyclohydrolase 1 type 2